MNKLISGLVILVVGDYVLDEMTKDKNIEVFPNPYRWLRNKILQIKSKEVLGE